MGYGIHTRKAENPPIKRTKDIMLRRQLAILRYKLLVMILIR